MATNKNTKNIIPATHTVQKTNTDLTVVVLNSKSQPAVGAKVSISPADASAVTNSLGEVHFKLGTQIKYNITASFDSNTVTVPYYVTPNGATRLVVNPTYVKSVEDKLHPSVLSPKGLAYSGISIVVIVIAVIVWKIILKKKKKD